MPDPHNLLSNHLNRLKRIGAKLKSGKPLTEEEMSLIGDKPAQQSYDSIAAAAAALEVDKAVLKNAKRDGAPGFRGSRVYPAELLPWLAKAGKRQSSKAGEEGKEELERQLLRIKIERQQFQFGVDRGEWVLSSDAAQWAARMVGEFVKVLDSIPSSLAPDIVGMATIAECELRIRSALEQAKAMLHSGPWSATEKCSESPSSGTRT